MIGHAHGVSETPAAGPFSIAGRRTVITGGTSGIGLGVARHFAAAGADVVISGRRENGSAVAAEAGGRFVAMDVGDDASVRNGLAEAATMLGGLDVLILNAGTDLDHGELAELDLEAFRRVVDVNLFGVARGLRFGLDHLREGGVVIATSSPAGRVGVPGLGAYAASKAGLEMLVRAAALELAPRGIRVTAVLPGFVESESFGGARGDVEWLAQLTAPGAIRPAADMGPVFQFLASPAAAPLHGATVQADDGMSAGLSSAVMALLDPE